MVGAIFDEWKISDLELESEVGFEEVDVAISGRNVGRGRSWGGRGTTLVVCETSTAGQGWGVGVKIPFCSVIIELLTFCRSGIGQCTHCRGGAESVLTLSSTVIGVGLHRLGANLTRKKGKYTSASPRCTCLPSRQICIGVALGDPPQTPLQCWLVGRTSTPRLRLGVLASQLVNIALKLHSEENKYISAKLKFNSASPRWTSTWPKLNLRPSRWSSTPITVELNIKYWNECVSLSKLLPISTMVTAWAPAIVNVVHYALCRFLKKMETWCLLWSSKIWTL